MKIQARGLRRPCLLPITRLSTTHSPKKNWRLAWLWPHRLPCIPHAQMPPLLQGTQPPSLFWTTAHFHHSLEFKVEDCGRPMLFTYQSLKNYRVKIASFSCDPGFSAFVAHIICAGQEKSWREFLWRTDKVKVLPTYKHWLVHLLWRTVWRLLKKWKKELPYDLAIPLLCMYLHKIIIGKDTSTPVFTATQWSR